VALTATGGDSSATAWDDFLASSARGQFQQTSAWAQVKAREGWSAAREYLDPIGPRSGGFQLLWKQSRLARIGYVSKGPVLPEETEAAVSVAIRRMTAVARRLRLAGVVVQPPDDSVVCSEALIRHGFFLHPVGSVIRATGIVSLEGGADGVIKRMSRNGRRDWRIACRQGVTLAWGTRNDLAPFFRLMCESARRQQQIPNPARVDLLETLWDAFPDRVSLAFAEHAGCRLAGLLMIRHGDRIVFWKKGWNPEQPHLFVNAFLETECLIWASALGLGSADVVSLSPEIAAKVLANERLSDEQGRSRDVFHLRLGVRPKLLPPAHLIVVNPLLRRVLYAGLRWRRLRMALERRVS
jgi:hypothetical protein